MSRGRQKVSFEGLLQEDVLGIFKIIRGFADLRNQRYGVRSTLLTSHFKVW